MATVVDDALPILDEGRQLLTDFGLRPVRVFIRRDEWSEEIQIGDLERTDTEILPRPKVETMGADGLRIKNITPRHSLGGWTPAQLQPDVSATLDFYYVVVSPDGALARYRLHHVDQTSPFRFELQLRSVDRPTPDY